MSGLRLVGVCQGRKVGKYLETTSPRNALLLAMSGGLNSVCAFGKWEKAGAAIGPVGFFSVEVLVLFLRELMRAPIVSQQENIEMVH